MPNDTNNISFINKLKDYLPSDKRKRLLSLLIIVLALPLTVYLAGQVARYLSRAAGEPVTLYFSPSSTTLAQGESVNVRLMLNAETNGIGFIRVKVNYDNNSLLLANELTTTSTLRKDNSNADALPAPFCQGTQPCIQISSRDTANSQGELLIVLGLNPQDNAPTGEIELATFTLTSVTNSMNSSTTLSIVDTLPEDLQIVNTEETDLQVNTNTMTINYPSSPTATPTSEPSACNTCYNFNETTNGLVDSGDIMVVASRWMKYVDDPEYDVLYDVACPGDVPDGAINTGDIMVVAAQWMQPSCTP